MALGELAVAKAMLASGRIGSFLAPHSNFAAEVAGCRAEGGSVACRDGSCRSPPAP